MEIPRRLMKYMKTAFDTGRGGEWRLMKRKPRFMPVLIIKFRGISIVFLLSTLFFFFLFYFLASKVCLLLTAAFYAAEIIINHFSQTNARKASNLNKFDEHGTCIVVACAFEWIILFVPDTRIYFLVKLFIIVIIIVLFSNFFRIQRSLHNLKKRVFSFKKINRELRMQRR